MPDELRPVSLKREGDGLKIEWSDGVTTFVEVGPGNVLSGLVKRIDRSVRTISVNDLASLEKAKEVMATA